MASVAIATVIVVLGGVIVVRHLRAPYRNGSTHEVTADCVNQSEIGRGMICWIEISSEGTSEWTGQATGAPLAWAGRRVPGTLRIIEDWAHPSAQFTAEGNTLDVWGGVPDGRHFFAA